MTLHTIKRIDGSIICEIEAETRAAAVSEAVRRGISLARANMGGAYMARANMAGAYMARAYMAGANMARAYMARANMEGANMAGANMEGANMEGAYMARANMAGAKLSPDQTIKSLVARATRITEPYEFFLWATDKGPLIRAGCRTMTPAEYREHIAADYYDAAKHAETARILDYFDAAWAAHEKDNAR